MLYALLLGPPNPPKLLIIDGEQLEKPPSSEREALLLIKKSLQKREFKGVRVEDWGFRHTVKYILSFTKNIYYLRENGDFFLNMVKLSKYNVFILGSHVDLPEDFEVFLRNNGIPWVSLGRISYLTSQCITIIHWLLDRLESSLYT